MRWLKALKERLSDLRFWQWKKRALEAEAEIERLLKIIADPTVFVDEVQSKGVSINIQHWAIKFFAASFAQTFNETKAVNYIEMTLGHPDTGPLIVTLQKLVGKTPHELREQAEKERDKAREEAEELRTRLKEAYDKLKA